MITFELKPHAERPGQQVVEIKKDGGLIGAITVDEHGTFQPFPEIRVTTKHYRDQDLLKMRAVDPKTGDVHELTMIRIFVNV
jgi:hypothetical protein